jgi:hypothetical protein
VRGPEELGRFRPFGYSGLRRVRAPAPPDADVSSTEQGPVGAGSFDRRHRVTRAGPDDGSRPPESTAEEVFELLVVRIEVPVQTSHDIGVGRLQPISRVPLGKG